MQEYDDPASNNIDSSKETFGIIYNPNVVKQSIYFRQNKSKQNPNEILKITDYIIGKRDKLLGIKSTKTLISSSHLEVTSNKPIIIKKIGKKIAKIFMDTGAAWILNCLK